MNYSKEELINYVTAETAVIKHLFTKIPADTFGYKPTENQRTTAELLQYLSYIVMASADLAYTGDSNAFTPYPEEGKNTTPENFNEMMDKQVEKFIEIVNKFSDEEYTQTISLFGGPQKTKAAYLIEFVHNHMAAYKMQLFLYIKSSGNTSIGTSNLWGGFDM